MTAILSTEHNKWAEVVEGSGEQCLVSPLSAKNVEHVLSTATVRGPQKTLCAAVLPFVSKMATDVHGASILTSLVKYGTPKTVESVVKELVEADKALWALKSEPAKEVATQLGELLDALIYREDCREEAAKTVVSSLSAAKVEKLLSEVFTLTAAGRLATLDAAFAARLVKEEKGKKALNAASSSTMTKGASASFCKRILGVPENSSELATASKYLFEVFFVPAPDAAHRPREEVVLAIVSKATPDVVGKVAKALQKWANLRELLKREAYANIFANVVARSADVDAAKKVVVSLFDNIGEIDTMLTSRKKPYLRLLAAIDDKPAIVAALEKKVKAPLAGKLRGSKVRYTNATMPRATATQQAIKAKLEQLRQNAGGKRAVVAKRNRE